MMRFNLKNSLFALFFLISIASQAQNGLNFQGVARNSNNVILASQPISLRLSIVQGTTNAVTEYTEVRKVTTNAQGLFNVVIGDTGTVSVVGNFSTIDWKLTPKFLKIEMDIAAGNNFSLIGTTQFQSVAYAQFASQVDAEKINGVLPVAKGGTGVASITALKASLALDKASVGLTNVDNTSDALKPISTATQTALDTKVDKVAGKGLSTNDYTTVEKTKLAAITGTNTGDQDLSSYATNAAITLKENAANKSTATDLGASATSDILFPTQKAVKTYVDGQINSGGIADGGILTRHLANGAVTGSKLASEIDGYKKFLDGAGNVTISNTVSTDVDVNTGSLASGGLSNWQSFTAGLSGKLSAVEFQTVNPSSSGPAPIAYVEIYGGQGLSGSLLGTSANISISGMGRNWYSFDLNGTNIRILAGNIYTARLVVNTTNQNYVYGDNAIYNGGISNISSTWDLNIKTKVKQFSDDPYLTTSVATGLYGGLVSNATHTGDVTGATALTIADGAVITSKIANGAVDLTTKVTGLLPTANVADAAITTAKIADGAVITSKIANGAVDLTTKVTGLLPMANVADAAVITSKIADGAVITSKIANGAVDLTTKVTGLLPTANIADAAITTAKIANGAVDLTTKVTGLLPTANVADAAITSTKIANGAVDLTTKVTGLLPTANVADAAITTAKIANGAVDLTTKVTGLLPTANIADAAITTAKIANSAVDLTTKVTGVLPTTNGGTGTVTNTANLFFATPNGASGAPSFRTIIASDLPSLTTSYISNNSSLPQTANFNITGNAIVGGTITVTTGVFTNTRTIGSATVGSLISSQDITVSGIKIGTGGGNSNSNTSIGFDALINNSYGGGNNAIGTKSLYANFGGNYNNAFGFESLISNIGGSNNNAIGFRSLYSNTEGNNNIAIGYQSLRSNINGSYNNAFGYQSLYSNASSFNNNAFGYQSLYSNTIGSNNFASGSQSLYSNTEGSDNIAIGHSSLYSNTIATGNIAFGYESLKANTEGYDNIAIGTRSLTRNTTGLNNVAVGFETLPFNTIGRDNVAVGNRSLYSNTEGNSNIAIGYHALRFNTTGSSNVALGIGSLYNNISGIENVTLGNSTLFSLNSGDKNVAIGFMAGAYTTSGSNNLLLGNQAYTSTATTSNQIVLGNSSISSLRAQVTSITALSDRRDKTDIVTIAEGIDFIKQLKPVTFTWNTRDKAKVGIKSAGFIAQDLLALQKASLIGTNLDLVSEDNPEKLEARYNNLLPVMVKAIQDQQVIIENQQGIIEKQQVIIEDQKKRLEVIEKLVAELIKK